MQIRTFNSVVNGDEWVGYVSHLTGELWEFFPRGHLDRLDEELILVHEIPDAVLDESTRSLRDSLAIGMAAWRHGPGGAWEQAPLPQGEVYYFRVESPTAYVGAWICCNEEASAERVLWEDLLEEGLAPYEILARSIAVEERLEGEALVKFRQAKCDGAAYQVFMWEGER